MVAQVATSSQSTTGASSDQKDATSTISYVSQNADNISTGLSASQYQQLFSLLNQGQVSQILTEPPQTGISNFCSYMASNCLINCHSSNDWIVDSGATYHITCYHDFLTEITSCDSDICLPIGSYTKVHKKGIFTTL